MGQGVLVGDLALGAELVQRLVEGWVRMPLPRWERFISGFSLCTLPLRSVGRRCSAPITARRQLPGKVGTSQATMARRFSDRSIHTRP